MWVIHQIHSRFSSLALEQPYDHSNAIVLRKKDKGKKQAQT